MTWRAGRHGGGSYQIAVGAGRLLGEPSAPHAPPCQYFAPEESAGLSCAAGPPAWPTTTVPFMSGWWWQW